MNLQKRIIRDFKEYYPNHTLKMISDETGIQITRVFRIFNGQEMKLKEFEALNEKIEEKKKTKDSELLNLVEEGLTLLSNETLNEIKFSLMRKLSMKKLVLN